MTDGAPGGGEMVAVIVWKTMSPNLVSSIPVFQVNQLGMLDVETSPFVAVGGGVVHEKDARMVVALRAPEVVGVVNGVEAPGGIAVPTRVEIVECVQIPEAAGVDWVE